MSTDQVVHLFELVSTGEAQTQAWGTQLGKLLQAGDVICLAGELGAGKTCLAQGIGRGLDIRAPIVSPTFTLIREYRGRLPLYHVDCYRLSGPEEAWALGLDDYFYGEGVTVVEWADHIQALLPAERLWIALAYLDPTRRRLRWTATGDRYVKLLAKFQDVIKLCC